VCVVYLQVYLATSSIHELFSCELSTLGILHVDQSTFTQWDKSKHSKILLPGKQRGRSLKKMCFSPRDLFKDNYNHGFQNSLVIVWIYMADLTGLMQTDS